MTLSQKKCAVILAAGKGTRMKSESPKVIVQLNGKPLIHYVIENIQKAGIDKIIIVVGYKKEEVIQSCSGFTNLEFVEQKEQLGTGHALLCTEPILNSFSGSILVACGDVPLIQASTFKKLLDTHIQNTEYATVLSADIDKPDGYGRILRNQDNHIIGIIEHKDASDSDKNITEINTGTYIFKSPPLFETLRSINTHNAQNEYYLPDLFKIYYSNEQPTGAVLLDNSIESYGINSPSDLEYVSSILNKRGFANS